MVSANLNKHVYMLPNLGIIAGSGNLPLEIASAYPGKSYIAAIKGEAHIDDASDHRCEYFSIGSAGKIIDYFKSNKVEKIIFIGGIKRPNLTSLSVDLVGSKLITKILAKKFLGTDNVLKTISDFIESYGFQVISPLDVISYQEFQTKITPSKQDLTDIEIGKNILKILGTHDVGQSIIVHNGCVLGIEAAEGTDKLIERCSILRVDDTGGVLVKMSKTSQDLRLDIPTIGTTTINNLYKYGFSGLAIEEKKVLIADSKNVINILNQNKMFITQIL